MDEREDKAQSPQDVPETPPEETFDDLDEALAWLEKLAARQGAPAAELPSLRPEEAESADWLQELPRAAASADDALDWTLPLDDTPPVDELPDWLDLPLDELQGAAPDEAPDATAATAESVPEEDQLDWLNQLTESVGAEELPTMHWPREQAPAAETSPAPTAPEVDKPVEDEAEVEDAMAWLEKLASGQGDAIEELPTMLADAAAEPAPDAPQAAGAEPPAVAKSVAGVEDADDTIDWLEQLAVDQRTPLEDLPSVADRVLASAIMSEMEGDLPQAAADAETAAPPERPAQTPDLETIEEPAAEAVEEPAAEAVEESAAEAVEEPAAEAVEEPAAEAVEEPAAAAEAAAEAVEVAEVTAEAVEEPAEEPVEAAETAAAGPEPLPAPPPLAPELAAALDYLEQLAAAQGIDLAQVQVDRAAATADLDAALARLDGLAAETAVALPPAPVPELADLSAEMPEDPDEALAWLERLAQEAALTEGELVAAQEEIAVVDESPTPVAAARVEESAPPAAPALEEEPDFLSEMPDDPDEAMVWLERLAARQGAPRAELPSLEELAEDELSDWIEPVAPPAETAVPDEAPETAREDLAAPEMEAAEEEEVPTAVDLPEPAEPELPHTPPALEDELTWAEWLAGREFDEDTLPSPEVDDLAWLDSLAEADAEAWLAGAEAEAAASALHAAAPEAPTRPWAAAPDEPDTLAELEAAPLELDSGRLTQAREALAGGDLVAAAESYQALLAQRGGLATLIADLETAVGDYPTALPFYRLLGDAYTENGQLQKAVETYRRALDHL